MYVYILFIYQLFRFVWVLMLTANSSSIAYCIKLCNLVNYFFYVFDFYSLLNLITFNDCLLLLYLLYWLLDMLCNRKKKISVYFRINWTEPNEITNSSSTSLILLINDFSSLTFSSYFVLLARFLEDFGEKSDRVFSTFNRCSAIL